MNEEEKRGTEGNKMLAWIWFKKGFYVAFNARISPRSEVVRERFEEEWRNYVENKT